MVFTMDSCDFNQLRQFEGQPWSSWTDYIGRKVPPEIDSGFVSSKSADSASWSFIRLSRSDMGIYGQCPTSEVFQLAICDFCGDKYKLAALADHIALRHSDGKKTLSLNQLMTQIADKSKLGLPKKGKTKNNKLAKDPIISLIEDEKSYQTKSNEVEQGVSSMSLISVDLVMSPSAQPPVVPHPENIPVLPTCTTHDQSIPVQVKVKVKKVRSDKVIIESNETTTLHINTILPKNKVKKPDLNKKSGKLHDSDLIESKVKISNGETISIHKELDEVSNMQPIVQLSPLELSSPKHSLLLCADSKKKLRTEKRPIVTRDRTYNPDKHCGVVGKENTKPCTRSLTCKSHSMSLRRAVRGRSKTFDALLADHRAEKEITKKSGSDNCVSEGPSVHSDFFPLLSHSLNDDSNIKINGFDAAEILLGSTRDVLSRELPRYSFPVSIRNPSSSINTENEPKYKEPETKFEEFLNNYSLGIQDGKMSSTQSPMSFEQRKTFAPYQNHPVVRRVGGLLIPHMAIKGPFEVETTAGTDSERNQRCFTIPPTGKSFDLDPFKSIFNDSHDESQLQPTNTKKPVTYEGHTVLVPTSLCNQTSSNLQNTKCDAHLHNSLVTENLKYLKPQVRLKRKMDTVCSSSQKLRKSDILGNIKGSYDFKHYDSGFERVPSFCLSDFTQTLEQASLEPCSSKIPKIPYCTTGGPLIIPPDYSIPVPQSPLKGINLLNSAPLPSDISQLELSPFNSEFPPVDL